MLFKVAKSIAIKYIESLAPILLGDKMETLLDMLVDGTHIALADPERVRAHAYDLVSISAEFFDASWVNAAVDNVALVALRAVLDTASYWGLAELRDNVLTKNFVWCSLSSFVSDGKLVEFREDELSGERVTVKTWEVPTCRGSIEQVIGDIRKWVADRQRLFIVTENLGFGHRVSKILREHDVVCCRLDVLESGEVELASSCLDYGFALGTINFVLLKKNDLTSFAGQAGSTKNMCKMLSRWRNFVEMVQCTIGGGTCEYLVTEYAPSKKGQLGDRLFVSADQLDQVTRYIVGEQPKLNKMGEPDWQTRKSRTRRHVRQITVEFIQLYSARMAIEGNSFGSNTPWQREKESVCAFVEASTSA